MHEPLKNRNYVGKKIFLGGEGGADFLAPKSSHQHEKQPVLGPGYFGSTHV